MKKALLVVACASAVIAVGCAAPAEEEKEVAETTQDPLTAAFNQDLASARRATAKYHDVNAAIADGYTREPGCAAAPSGGMGIHFVNRAIVAQQPPVADRPPLLLYEPQADGSLELIGVEYFTPVIVQGRPWFPENMPPPTPHNPAPSLFGVTFDGPMPGHQPGMPWHYDLHVWIWRNNPAGTFNMWNPDVSCQYFTP